MQNYDFKILKAVNKKDHLLYRQVYASYYASLCRYAKRFLGRLCDEEDLVQEVFLKLWEGDGHFENTTALSAYLYRAVHNACMVYIRDCKVDSSVVLSDTPVYESEDNERNLIEEEYFRQIYTAIDQLTDQRKAIVLKLMEGKTNEEIADELHISVNTVKTLKKKAYSALREILSVPAFHLFLLLAGC